MTGYQSSRQPFRDNRFLTEDDRLALENEKDPYYKAVYSEGTWGVLGDVIFRNWRTDDLDGVQEDSR